MDIEQKIFPVYHYRFWPAFWVHMRPYLLFVSGVAGWAGLSLSTDFQLGTWEAVLSIFAFFFAYGFGQALTDCFQTDTDRLSAPYRPLSKGMVSSRDVGVVAVIGLVSVSLILITLNYRNLLLCGLSIFGLATYTYVKRNLWWAGPFYNAWIVALLPAMGYLISTNGNLKVLVSSELIWLMGLSLFAYSNFVLMGYLKDITADRQTGYRTFPVVFGWNATVWAGNGFVLLSMALVFYLVTPDPLGLGIALLGSVIALSGQLYAHFTSNKTEQNATFPITATVRSFILWHLAVGVAMHHALLLFAVLFYLFFEIVLWARPMREQI